VLIRHLDRRGRRPMRGRVWSHRRTPVSCPGFLRTPSPAP